MRLQIDHATEWADPAKWGNDHAELSRRIKIKEQLDGLPAKLRKHALVRAASNGDTAEVASLLDESGALDLNSTLFPGKFKLEGTFKEGCGLGIPGTLGAPPLGQAPLIMFAALHGQEEVVSLLFERGAKAYGAEQYFDAVYWFTEAILCSPHNAVLYGNRSAAFAQARGSRAARTGLFL